MSETFEQIKLDVADNVATITLSRATRMNAFTPKMAHEIIAALDRTDADDDVRAVIFTGEGRAFCAGADLGSGGDTFNYDAQAAKGGAFAKPASNHRDRGGLVALRIFESLKPSICAFNGAAVGVGITMMLPVDMRLASTEAKFGFVFARRGIVPEAASSWFLPRLVGVSAAVEWTTTGRVFLAQEAFERGLVRSLHAPGDLLPAARALAREIADNAAPVSASLARRMMWEMLGADHPMRAHELDTRLMVARGRSADAAEGIGAFLEKRAAKFPMKVSSDLPPVPRFSALYRDSSGTE
ncbi:MAG: crotonase/enoyl-CoA hydratase family protein [Hyphomonadaceae bacterium]